MRQATAQSCAALPTIEVHGVTVCAISELQCVAHILDQMDAGHGGWVVTANLDHLRRLVCDGGYRQLCDQADIIVADGMPLIWASRIRGTPLPQRVAGSSLIWSLSDAAAGRGRSLFLLGGAPGTAEAAAQVLGRRLPRLQIAGTYCPPVGFDQNEANVTQLARMLSAAKPDIVYVALGSPKQELLIGRLRHELQGAWWLGVGISFSYLCGDVTRAPHWMQRLGIEWLHRLAQEPRRLTKRYLVHGCPFALRLLITAAAQRLVVGPSATKNRTSRCKSA